MADTTPTPAQADEKARREAIEAFCVATDEGPFDELWPPVQEAVASRVDAVLSAYLAAIRPEVEPVAWRWRSAPGRAWAFEMDPSSLPDRWLVEGKWIAPEVQPLFASPPAPAVKDVPLGAIENGRAFADRVEASGFECEAGRLSLSSDWQEFRRCFEHLAEWAARSALLPPEEAQAAAPAEALPSPDLERDFFSMTPQQVHAALAKPASEPAGGGVLRDENNPKVILDGIAEALESAGYVHMANKEGVASILAELAALSSPASSSPAGAEALPAGVEAAHDALREAEAAFETIRIILIKELDEPGRLAFWRAVEARNALRKLLGFVEGCQPEDDERCTGCYGTGWDSNAERFCHCGDGEKAALSPAPAQAGSAGDSQMLASASVRPEPSSGGATS